MSKSGLRVIEAEPIGDGIVKLLEEALEEARKGELSSVGLALVFRDGASATRWSEVPNMNTLAGAASRLVWSLHQALDEA